MFKLGNKVSNFLTESVGTVVYVNEATSEVVIDWENNAGITVHSNIGNGLRLVNAVSSSGFVNVFRGVTGNKEFYVGTKIYPSRQEAIDDAALIRIADAYVDTAEIEWAHK